MLSKKKIVFKESSPAAKHLLETPKPASTYVPQWYKKDKLFGNGTNNVIDAVKLSKMAAASYKMCVPLIDSMVSGYILELPATVVVTNVGVNGLYEPRLNWQVTWNVCDIVNSDALQSYPVPYNHNRTCFRWSLDWTIETPQGYSLWVTHPSHRYDLPFTTINGFVDTDKLPNPLLLPFFLHEGFEGIIEQGTPIAQVLPVKRESWVSSREKTETDLEWKYNNIVKLDFVRAYKNRFWSKKEYR